MSTGKSFQLVGKLPFRHRSWKFNSFNRITPTLPSLGGPWSLESDLECSHSKNFTRVYLRLCCLIAFRSTRVGEATEAIKKDYGKGMLPIYLLHPKNDPGLSPVKREPSIYRVLVSLASHRVSSTAFPVPWCHHAVGGGGRGTHSRTDL